MKFATRQLSVLCLLAAIATVAAWTNDDGVVSTSKAGAVGAMATPYIRVEVKNNCINNIRVAIRFHNYQTNRWESKGFDIVKPGQVFYIANTAYRYVYVYAQDVLRPNVVWEGNHCFELKKQKYCGRPVDLGTKLDVTRIYSFNCP